MAHWRTSPTEFAVRLYVAMAVLALLATAKASRTVFVTSVVIVAVLSVLFVAGLIALRRHFARYPLYPKSDAPDGDERSTST